MRKLLLVGLAGGAGCWTSSSTPASEPRPIEGGTSTGGATYGGLSMSGTGHAERVDVVDTSGSGVSSGSGTATGRPGTIGAGAGGGASAPPTVTIGDPSGQSQALDPAIIRRLVRRNLNKIQYCYEKELLVTPGLEGRVNVRFSVGAEGRVTQSTGSGMPPVDACVASVIAAIEFPKPTGAGVVIVNYPFIFQQPAPAPDPNATP